MLRNLYKMFIETDATLVEINPLAETPSGEGAPSQLDCVPVDPWQHL